MKLFELINTPIKTVNTKQRIDRATNNRLHSAGSRSSNATRLGSGAYGAVEQHKNLPPGMVVKYGRMNGSTYSDGYFNFLKQISKSDRMARNPYLPRVYSVKVIDNTTFAVVMERLHDVEKASKIELEAMIDKMFGGIHNLTDVVPKSALRPISASRRAAATSTESGTYSAYDYVRLISSALHRFSRGGIASDRILDPRLKEAVMMIKSVFRRSQGSPDIHTGNIMIRRGPTGVQLVLTDPLE